MRVEQTLALRRLLTGRRAALLVDDLDAGLAREDLDRVGEGQMVELAHEADRVTRLPTAEAVAGEDVVLQNECVARLDNRAIDLFDAVGLLDRLNYPSATGKRLRGLDESVGVFVNLEEGLVEILVDKMHTVERRRLPPRKTFAHLHGDAIGADAQASAHVTHELQVRTLCGIEHDRAVLGDTAIGCEVPAQPAIEILRRFVQRGPRLEVAREPKDEADVAVLSHRTTRKPLLELCVLGADEGRPGAIDGQTTVAVRNPVRDTEGGWNGPSSPAPRVDGNKPVARTQVLRQHLCTALRRSPQEPAVLVGGEDLFLLTVASERDLHQSLNTEAPERCIHPVGVAPQDAMGAAGELADLSHALPGDYARLTGEAVEEAEVAVHVERWSLLVVKGAKPFHPTGAGRAQLDVVADDLLDRQPLTDRDDDLVSNASGHSASSRQNDAAHPTAARRGSG